MSAYERVGSTSKTFDAVLGEFGSHLPVYSRSLPSRKIGKRTFSSRFVRGRPAVERIQTDD